jgi:pimeloyl-ACP methyl ester carboxylesterase
MGGEMVTLATPDRSTMIEVNRTTIRLWEWGDPARPPVVMIHGGWDHGRMFDGLAPEIAALGFHAVALDLRGHGDSGGLGRSGGCWLAWNLDLALLIRHLGRPAGLVGHSMGGGQALSVAGTFPHLVTWVVSIDGLGPSFEMMAIADHRAETTQWLAHAETLRTAPMRTYASIEEMAARRRQVNVRLSEDWALHLARHGSRPWPEGGFVWKSDPAMRVGGPSPFGEGVLRAQNGLIECPVLALTGAEPDQWSDLSDEEIAGRLAAMPSAHHEVVAGAGHYVHLEQPDAVAGHVARFVGA